MLMSDARPYANARDATVNAEALGEDVNSDRCSSGVIKPDQTTLAARRYFIMGGFPRTPSNGL